jgi:hypothetical protein
MGFFVFNYGYPLKMTLLFLEDMAVVSAKNTFPSVPEFVAVPFHPTIVKVKLDQSLPAVEKVRESAVEPCE